MLHLAFIMWLTCKNVFEIFEGTVTHTFQYSVTEYFTQFGADVTKLPGIHFKYDMSPIAVKLKEDKVGFLHFITRLCATIGGAFALTSLANNFAHRLF